MSIPATMRALQQVSLNGPQDLCLITDAPVPVPGPGEVLIRVTAAGVNFGDVSQARGTFLGGPQPPYLAGFEAAGEIAAIGEAVTGLEPGARVVGVGIGGGAFAEYMVLPAAAAVPVPAGWAEEQALGLVVNWPTALAALRPLGRIAAGETVLVHAAAGGTGQAAVTMAKHHDATVIASASPGKHETVRALGADHVLDSRSDSLAAEVLRLTGGTGADLVLGAGGGATLGTSLTAAKRVTGRVVVYGVAGSEASISNWELVYRYQVHIIGLNIGVLIQAAPQIFGDVMGELFALIAEGRSSVRTWLYRIATNVCLTALGRSGRRVLPSGLGGPEPDPQAAPEAAGPDVRWLQPIPDALVAPDGADPAAVVAAQEGLRLALIASLQYLPGTQRAVLTLRDVLGFSATEVVGMLGLSVPAVKSSLQRARGRLRELSLSAGDVAEPASPRARAVLDQYIAAFQDADATALQRLLRHDAQMEATQVRNWFEGSKTCVPFLRTWILGAPGDWRMLPTSANGQPAAVGYRRGADGARHAYGVVVLAVTGTDISRIVSFGDPALAPRFGFPATLPADRPS